MHIIIPMSGVGRRFLDAGYTDPKPLIVVDGKPIIEHVVNLFPCETNITFICSEHHLATTSMTDTLKRIAPSGTIKGIAPHKKGPVYAVAQVFDSINDEEEVIVNYCDFSKYWDYRDFLRQTRARNADGALSAYKGFHPHMLGTTNYAFMRDDHQWLLEIQEKKPFTDNRMNEYASDGTYYFKKGIYVKKYFSQLMKDDISLNGEYYVSMIYNLLVRDGLNVSIYEIEHMLQWGTPHDLEEYQQWSQYFYSRSKNVQPCRVPQKKSITLIPLAGKGERFRREGYVDPKPLIKIDDVPMVVQAARHLPPSEKNIFVCLHEHTEKYPLEQEIHNAYPHAKIVELNSVTEGQACTCKHGIQGENPDAALLISASDNGVVWNNDRYQALLHDDSVDAIVWSFRHHPSSAQNPQMYGWVQTNPDDTIVRVSVKQPISDTPYHDHAIVGTFYFRTVRYFLEAVQDLYTKNIRVNNEFYVDSCINELIARGRRAVVFEVDHYICWGTPNDVRTYLYWQTFFDKCSWHPYVRRTAACDHERR